MQSVSADCFESVPAQSEQSNPADYLTVVSPQDKPWDIHRLQSEEVSEIFTLGMPHHQRQAQRMSECANNLEFGYVLESTGTGELKFKLKQTWFCRVRFCPICQWRRSLMWVGRFHCAFPRIFADHPEMRYLLLTLTVRNCPILELRSTVDGMNKAWDRMIKRKAWPALGFVRSLEITRGKDGSAHPHFHCLLALPPSYFGSKYLSTAKWADLWKDSLRVDYTPICDVRIIKPKKWEKLRKTSALGVQEVIMDETRAAITSPEFFNEGGGRSAYDEEHDAIRPTKMEILFSAISEVIKYAVKPSDMVSDPLWLLELSDQLRNARAVALGGILRDYLSDKEPEDLVTENAEGNKDNSGGIHFGWREDPQFAQYKRKKA